MQPRRLDYVMARGCTLGDGQVILCKDRAASDHDGVAAPFGTHAGGGARRELGPTQAPTTTPGEQHPGHHATPGG